MKSGTLDIRFDLRNHSSYLFSVDTLHKFVNLCTVNVKSAHGYFSGLCVVLKATITAVLLCSEACQPIQTVCLAVAEDSVDGLV